VYETFRPIAIHFVPQNGTSCMSERSGSTTEELTLVNASESIKTAAVAGDAIDNIKGLLR
jgi:hypothetical protein